jgi:REP element-mobilizing transposase RayT
MPRHTRVHAEGLLYHVMARGNNGQNVFLRESDYQAFIEALRTVRQRYPFSLYAYVLMSNHFHLLLEVDRFPTARILQSLLTGYVRRFNKTHRRRGHLFEGRYKAICAIGIAIFGLVRYIHLSPVRARWSSGPASGSGAVTGILGKGKSGLIDRTGDGRVEDGRWL